ncbi:MAG: galactokinase [Anaerolineales bacterium]|nr:galactokinase [Anaerolineae bacterium]PWB77807.1 MAG: galactokinase [Anaerolineales bacterium]
MNLQEHTARIFRETFNEEPAFVVRAPGRVNLLGEHVDYNDGFVLPAAIDRAVWIAGLPTEAPHSTLLAVDLSERVSFSSETIAAKTDLAGQPLPHWAEYPAGVAWALNAAGFETPALNAVFASDVPRGAGLSSSAAVEMGFLSAWQASAGWEADGMTRARIGQRAENEYVGVNCGIMDQFASACGQRNHALFLDCRSLEWQTVPLPKDAAIVIADTTVRRSLSTSAYNDRRAACEEAARLLGVKSLRDVSVEMFHRNRGKLPAMVARRAQHVVEEIQRTEQSVFLLKQGNAKAFGRLMNECHASLRDLYEVSCPELDAMVEIAQSLPGCRGARLTGAGFGGCTVNLVDIEKAAGFTQKLAVAYERRTNRQAKIYICQAEEGAGVVERR